MVAASERPAASALAQFLSHRVCFVFGKGGAGKSIASSALAVRAAREGKRVILMECDPRAPAAEAFGVSASFEPVQASTNFRVMTLDGRHALEEYIRLVVPASAMLGAVFSSRVYEFFVNAAPGLRELMMLGKVYYESRKANDAPGAADLIIVDAFASGHALAILKMPEAARASFGESIVGREANNIAAMLSDRERCAFAIVTTAESLTVAETEDTARALAAIGHRADLILFNRFERVTYGTAQADELRAFSSSGIASADSGHLADIAQSGIARARECSEAIRQVRRQMRCPVIEIPELGYSTTRELIDRAADSIG
jgi:anion-transporting  ArsA/GET3 family ATPase